MTVQNKLLAVALVNLEQASIEVRRALKDPDREGEGIAEFDSALEVALEARNNFCQSENMTIENGTIDWEQSEAQKEEEGEANGE